MSKSHQKEMEKYMLIQDHTDGNKIKWRSIWKWKGRERIKTFIWLMCQDRLLTNTARFARNMTEDNRCQKCEREIETSLHVIKDYLVVSYTWLRMVKP